MTILRIPAAIMLVVMHATTVASPPTLKHASACVNGMAEGFPCSNVDLAAHLSLSALGATAGQDGNDIWGWTDPATGREYALVGVGNGTSFVDVTVPDHPIALGLLPTHTGNSLWRDIKVYANHAFIVSEAVGHGMQVFDLTRLRGVQPPATFTADAHYAGFGRAHNIVINEASGFAYAVGSRQGTTQCSGGLHMINVSVPVAPVFAGCFAADGYTHDAHCVMYDGPDTQHSGREICFNSNENTLTIVDVTTKSAPVQIARKGYPGNRYAHQGWLTPDHRWFLMNDELDEINNNHNTRTYVWNVEDLDDPKLTFAYTAAVAATDHNLYIRDQYAFLANYKSGLRILDLSAIAHGDISEVAFFDTYPADNTSGFDGAWSSYPFFESGTVIVSDISRGLFVLQPRLCREPDVVSGLGAKPAGDNAISLAWQAGIEPGTRYEVFRELGGCGTGPGNMLVDALASPGFVDTTASGQVNYGYRVRSVAQSGQCRSAFSACVEASTTGACTAPPMFAGLDKASSAGTPRCTVDLSWNMATPSCAGPALHEVHRSTDADFVPAPDTLIQQAGQAVSTRDFEVSSGQTYHYAVRARDGSNGASEGNLVRHSATPTGPLTAGTWSNGAEPGEAFLGSGAVVPLHVAWHVAEGIAHSGSRSYDSGYPGADCIALSTPAIDLAGAGSAMLGFHHRFGIVDGRDGGRVEVSTDGVNWAPVVPFGGYPGQIAKAGNACGWPVGTGVYSGTALTEWDEQTVDLSAYSGRVYLRWVFSTAAGEPAEGWWIDTISISPALVDGSCSTIPAASSVSITAVEPEPSAAGSMVTIVFAVEHVPSEGSGPTGDVIVTAGEGAGYCVATLPQNSCSLLMLQPGMHTVTASYPGGNGYPGASDSVAHEVLAAQASMQLIVTPASPAPAGEVQVLVTVGGAQALAAPTGSVAISSNREPATCMIDLPATSCSLQLQAAGTHLLGASYSGDALYRPGTTTRQYVIRGELDLFSDGFEQTVPPAPRQD
jgi:choice-of-anchor B domain-containing protein